ncbi:MAG: hypothetical protein Q9211_005075 [Gyalolechia sp. 1 TL-2023]
MDAGSTNGLVIRNHHPRGGSGLPNQGQIDWVALANTTVSASVGFLSRISGAGVDPFTIAVGQAVASKFQMSRLGIHRLENAIKNLQYRSVLGEVTGEAYTVADITIGTIARDQPRDEMHTNANDLQTRVPWQSVLRQTFGKQASILLRLKVDFGTAIGSASRMVLEYTKPQVDVSAFLPPGGWSHGAASYGSEFLHFVCATFPEIASSRDIMETASQRSFSEAVAAYQRTQERLRSTCECNVCHKTPEKITGLGVRGKDICLPTLCGFVIQLAVDLSGTSVPPSLLPTRSGLELLYLRYSSHRVSQLEYARVQWEYVNRGFFVPTGPVWELMIVMFTGYGNDNRFTHSETLASVTDGLCVYLGVLNKLSDKPEEMHRIFLIPGRIETRTGRLYATLNDTAQFRVPVFNFNASPAVPCLTMPTVPQPFEEKYEVSTVVEENFRNLTTHFILKKSLNESVVCSPSVLRSEMRNACEDNRGEGEFKNESLETVGCRIGLRLVGGDPVARLIALLIASTVSNHSPGQSQSRSRTNQVRRDGWLDYEDPDTLHINDDGEVLESEHAETDQLHTQGEAEERTSSPYTLLHPPVMLQGDECLPYERERTMPITTISLGFD